MGGFIGSAASGSSGPVPVFKTAVKPADTARISAVVSADPDLVLTLGAGNWAIDSCVFCTTGNPQGGLTIGLNYTGTTVVGEWGQWLGDSLLTNYSAEMGANSIPSNFTSIINHALGLNRNVIVNHRAVLVSSASGVLSVAWAIQNGSGAPTTLKRGSWIRAQQL